MGSVPHMIATALLILSFESFYFLRLIFVLIGCFSSCASFVRILLANSNLYREFS